MDVTYWISLLAFALAIACLFPLYHLVKVSSQSAISAAFLYLFFSLIFAIFTLSTNLFTIPNNLSFIHSLWLFLATLMLSLSSTKFLEISGMGESQVSLDYVVRFSLILGVVILTGILFYGFDFLRERTSSQVISYYANAGGLLISEWTLLTLITSALAGKIGGILRLLSITLLLMMVSYILPAIHYFSLAASVTFFVILAVQFTKLYQL